METQNRIDQIERAIEKLYSLDNVEKADVFNNPIGEDWNYYYSFSGWLNKKYFNVYIDNHKYYNKEKIEISDTTDCKEEITELITKLLQDE